MLVVVTMEWASQGVSKVIETRLKNPVPPEIKALAELYSLVNTRLSAYMTHQTRSESSQ